MTATHTPSIPRASRHARRRGLSIIAPAPNEYATAEEIYQSVRKQAEKLHVDWELIFVHESTCEESLLIQRLVRDDNAHVRALITSDSQNRSSALALGYREAQGELVFTLESDMNDKASELSRFLGRIDWDADKSSNEVTTEEPADWWQNVLPRGVLRAA